MHKIYIIRRDEIREFLREFFTFSFSKRKIFTRDEKRDFFLREFLLSKRAGLRFLLTASM